MSEIEQRFLVCSVILELEADKEAIEKVEAKKNG
jgi:hypothetical protein